MESLHHSPSSERPWKRIPLAEASNIERSASIKQPTRLKQMYCITGLDYRLNESQSSLNFCSQTGILKAREYKNPMPEPNE